MRDVAYYKTKEVAKRTTRNRSNLNALTMPCEGSRNDHTPYFSNEVVNCVPCHRTIPHSSPPSHQVRGHNIRVSMQVVGHRDFAVFKGWIYESYPERFIIASFFRSRKLVWKELRSRTGRGADEWFCRCAGEGGRRKGK